MLGPLFWMYALMGVDDSIYGSQPDIDAKRASLFTLSPVDAR